MENQDVLKKSREAVEEHIQSIIRKNGNMTPIDIEVLTKDLCALEVLKRLEKSGDSEGYSENSYRRGRSMTTGRYMSRDEMPYHDGSSGGYHDGGGSSTRYYDGGSSNSGYSGHSIQDRMIANLEGMFDKAQSEHERQTVRDWITRLRQN